MNTIIYLLQVSACTAIFYLFYRLLLNRLTFFVINRCYLLATLFLSFIIPVLKIPVNPQQDIAVVQQVVYVNTLQIMPINTIDVQNTVATKQQVDWRLVIQMFYFVAVAALSFHLIITLIIFFKKLKGRQITKVGRVNILRNTKKLNNGSFFNYIFLNDEELSKNEIQQIIAHEMLHVKLYHSADRLLVKIAQIILWFNPFIYFYAKAIEENHEFEVDCTMANSTDKKLYADLLLHLSVAGQGLLYHSFSKIPLKKRITMLFNQPSAKMKKVIYVLIVPVVLISCLAFARLKSDGSAIGFKSKSLFPKLKDKHHFQSVKQDKNYRGKNSIKNNFVNTADTIKYRQKLKQTPEQIREQIKEEAERKAYLQTEDFKQKEKLANEINGKTITVKVKDIIDKSSGKVPPTIGNEQCYLVGYNGYEYLIQTNSLLNKIGDEITVKVFMVGIFKNSPDLIIPPIVRNLRNIKTKEIEFKAYRQTDDFKRKEKLLKDIEGKVVTVKIKAFVDKADVRSVGILNTGNHKTQGYMISYNGNDYFMRTQFGQEKQLNNLLKVGDEIKMEVFGSAFGPNSPIIIQPAFIEKNNVKIFQLAEADKIPTYPFLYEANKVRFADGEITHIQKYPNGKWKSAILEVVNGYKFTLYFKPSTPNFNQIEESDHVRLRFVHEVKTGAKSYQINDWVSISNNMKDYGIKNPELFYKFYEVEVAKTQDSEHNFEVTKLTYAASEDMLIPLKKDQPNSYITAGKTINVSILLKERERVFNFLSAKFPQVLKSDIIFRVDTTAQKGFCSIETVVKSLI